MKKRKLKQMAGLILVISVIGLGACRKKGCTDKAAINYNEEAKKDDGSCILPEIDSTMVLVSENIAENTTWTKGKTYILTTRVAVLAGATLTIEPGVLIKAEAGTGPNASALIIARGAKIMAQGTATEPIIFTSIADEIQPGQIASPNLSTDLDGLWGGLLVLGNATISADAATAQIEGIPVSDSNGLYGGSDDADNSGVIEYVSIRHGGANIGEGNEINGLTLGGVGSGTTINHVEVIANQDDGIEWFGGTVNVSDVVVWNVGDDAIDTDQSWGGTLDNFAVINPRFSCLELDGPEGAMEAKHTIKNGSVKVSKAVAEFVSLDPNSYVDLDRIYFFDLKSGEGQTFNMIPTDYTCSFTNLEATLPGGDAVTDYFLDGSHAFVTTVAAGANTVGVNKAEFNGWSWTAIEGALDDF